MEWDERHIDEGFIVGGKFTLNILCVVFIRCLFWSLQESSELGGV